MYRRRGKRKTGHHKEQEPKTEVAGAGSALGHESRILHTTPTTSFLEKATCSQAAPTQAHSLSQVQCTSWMGRPTDLVAQSMATGFGPDGKLCSARHGTREHTCWNGGERGCRAVVLKSSWSGGSSGCHLGLTIPRAVTKSATGRLPPRPRPRAHPFQLLPIILCFSNPSTVSTRCTPCNLISPGSSAWVSPSRALLLEPDLDGSPLRGTHDTSTGPPSLAIFYSCIQNSFSSIAI